MGSVTGQGGESRETLRVVCAWSIFKPDTKYFQPSTKPFMLNFRVEDLDGLLEKLREEGVWIDPNREDYDYRRFAWIMDPEGNRIELWEPPRRS